MRPMPGDLLHVTRAASVQFVRPIFFRVIRVHDDWHTYQGWLWLDGCRCQGRCGAGGGRTLASPAPHRRRR
ncbi:hypothetical protein [Micromonospora carbonacea]